MAHFTDYNNGGVSMYKVKWGWYDNGESNYELFEPEEDYTLAQAKEDAHWYFIETVQNRYQYGIDWCAVYYKRKKDELWTELESWEIINGFSD